MKLKLAFGIISAAMLFSACSEGDSVTNISDEAKDKGMITLKVVDSNTGLAIDSAEVYSLIDAKAKVSDSLGVVSWSRNVIGDYEYTVSKEGYATRTFLAKLTEDSQGDLARVEDRVQLVQMFKLGVSVKGTVLLKDPQSGNLSAASKVKVVLSYDQNYIVPAEIMTVTDSSGVYEFKNLAEGQTYSVKVPQVTVNDMTYAAEDLKAVNAALRTGEQRVLEPITMGIVGLNPELIKDNLRSIETTDYVNLTFSTKLVADSVPTSWKVYKGDLNNYVDNNGLLVYQGATEVLVTASLDEDGKTVIVKPVSEKWTKLATYTLVGKVYTSEGRSVAVEKKFVPGSAVSRPDLIKNLVAEDYYGRYIDLIWTKGENEVKGYKVFFQTSSTADFEEYKAWSNGELPIDSTTCKKTKSQLDCNQYDELGEADRSETNYYWYTKYTVSEPSLTMPLDWNSTRDSASYTYIWWTKYDTTETTSLDYTRSMYKVYFDRDLTDWCYSTNYNGSTCPQYIDEGKYYYDYTTVYVKIEPIANDSCVTTSSSYTTCAEYVLYDRMPEDRSTLYFTRTPSDSVSCTANSGVLYTSVAKCELLYEENGKYNSEDYNYYWYKEYASIKPTAESNRAFVAMENVLREDTEWVKFIVLPFVVVEGDTVMADGVAATPSIFKVDAE